MKATSIIINQKDSIPAIEKGTLFFHPDQPREIFLCHYIDRNIDCIRGTLVYAPTTSENPIGSITEYRVSSVVPFNGEVSLAQSW